MDKRIAILLVTCSLEPSRARVLEQVIDNIKNQVAGHKEWITAFDNASTIPGTIELLTSTFENVFQSDRNVGYWSALDWWLHGLEDVPYTYVIESDMIHYSFDSIRGCADYLDANPSVGGVRLHEYSVKQSFRYNKDKPHPQSRRTVWQSHTNRITGQPIKLSEAGPIHASNFLTQLPALNRRQTMIEVLDSLDKMGFSEPDFQRLYHERFKTIGILDGGIFHHDPGSVESDVVTGSWTNTSEQKRVGYHNTRLSFIAERNEYSVARVSHREARKN